MFMKRILCCLLALLFAAACRANAETVVPAAPDSEAIYPDFEVWVDGKPTPVWQCRVSAIPFNRIWPGYQRSLDQTELAGFATWETDAAATEAIFETVAGSSPEMTFICTSCSAK